MSAAPANGHETGKASDVLCHQPRSFDWRQQHGAPHPMKRLPEDRFREACAVLEQIVRIG